MKIKQLPEDFIVEEINDLEIGTGDIAVFKVTKINYNTEEVAQIIAHKLRIPRKFVSYSGSKDRNAMTKQYFTIKISKDKANFLEKQSIPELKFEFLGFTSQMLSLGSLKGNKFIITIRNLENNFQINKKDFFPNYFGEQRFSTHNSEIGESIIKKEFLKAVSLIKETSQNNKQLMILIENNHNNPIKILRSIPKHLLMMYLHAYQSRLFNKLLSLYVQKKFSETFFIVQEQELFFPKKYFDCIELELPLPGFGVEVDELIKDDYEKILKAEQIIERDFIIRSLPGMSLEGVSRKAFVKAEKVIVNSLEEDELNKNKKKLTIEFMLNKGCYATIYLKNLGIEYE